MDPPDSLLVELALTGDDGAFGQLVSRHQQAIYAYVHRMIKDPHVACDITQMVFIRAYRSLSQLRDATKLRPWLFAIAVNQSRSWQRRRKPFTSGDGATEGGDIDPLSEKESVLADPRPTPEAAYAATEVAERVAQAIDSLPPKYRETAVLRFQHRFKIREISTALGLGFAAADSRVRRAQAMLRARLETELVHDWGLRNQRQRF